MSRLAFTLKAWPAITAVTVGLCYLTQIVARLFGVELPEQANLELVKRCAGWNLNFAILIMQILVIMPAIEEILFRWGLFRQVSRLGARVSRLLSHDQDGCVAKHRTRIAGLCLVAVISSALFSAAHYIAQPFPDAAFVALFFFGLAQCWLYHRTGRIWCAMLNHALFNLTNFILLFIIPS